MLSCGYKFDLLGCRGFPEAQVDRSFPARKHKQSLIPGNHSPFLSTNTLFILFLKANESFEARNSHTRRNLGDLPLVRSLRACHVVPDFPARRPVRGHRWLPEVHDLLGYPVDRWQIVVIIQFGRSLSRAENSAICFHMYRIQVNSIIRRVYKPQMSQPYIIYMSLDYIDK